MVRTDRKQVQHPMWRKKVDRTLLQDRGVTVLPAWVVKNFGIEGDFTSSKRNSEDNKIKIHFLKETFEGAITIQTESRASTFHRLWILDQRLTEKLREEFLMTYLRGLEQELQQRKNKEIKDKQRKWDSEVEIPFWEFIDIEYSKGEKAIYLTAHWKQKVSFPMFFKEIAKSQIMNRIEKEVLKDKKLVITKGDWKERNKLKSQLNNKNVIYYLIDKEKKELYVGMAENLTTRVTLNRPEIPGWTHYRFDSLPTSFDSTMRLEIEKMLIRSFASLLDNNPSNNEKIKTIDISEYKLVNKQISKK